ncbi:MAG: PaaI family thioesterase, partial [Alphaproteobacteria bacterium]|nr:PaaI family thioesterase [Alphaproteobacteria bacterium]
MSAPVTGAAGLLRRHQQQDRGPAAQLLGHRLTAIDTALGTVEVEFQAAPHLFNPLGMMQGGFTAAMLEQALLDATTALTDLQYDVATLAVQCNFLAAIGPGCLLCRAGMLRQGRSTAFAEARLFTSA